MSFEHMLVEHMSGRYITTKYKASIFPHCNINVSAVQQGATSGRLLRLVNPAQNKASSLAETGEARMTAEIPSERVRKSQSPSLLRFLALHLAIGATVAVLVVTALILTDAHALGRLIMQDRDPVVAIAMLMIGFIITLGSAAMGAAIMGLPSGDNGITKGRRRHVKASGEPVLARATVSGARR
jgi:hypothetical protein